MMEQQLQHCVLDAAISCLSGAIMIDATPALQQSHRQLAAGQGCSLHAQAQSCCRLQKGLE